MARKSEHPPEWPPGREIHIIVPGSIGGWRRAADVVTKAGVRIRITPSETKIYSGKVQQAAALAMGGAPPIPIKAGVLLDVLGVYMPPASWSDRKRQRALAGEEPKVADPDVDNGLVKGILDALQKIIYVNDKQVIMVRAAKVFGARERLELWASVAGPLTEHAFAAMRAKTRTQSRLHDAPAMEQSRDLLA